METKRQEWERQPQEPTLWYTRFKFYLDMGKNRSINSLYEFLRDGPEKGRINQRKAPATFYEMPNRWNWRQRAAAFDDYNDEQNRQAIRAAAEAEAEAEKQARREAQAKRREIIDELLGQTRMAIGLAELENWDTNTARRRFPDLIRFMEILLKANRAEYGEPLTENATVTTTTTTTERPVTADDMAAAIQALKAKDFPTITLPILTTITTTTTTQPNHDD